jgi:hypothetical protein
MLQRPDFAREKRGVSFRRFAKAATVGGSQAAYDFQPPLGLFRRNAFPPERPAAQRRAQAWRREHLTPRAFSELAESEGIPFRGKS